jgi:hypothetical protein
LLCSRYTQWAWNSCSMRMYEKEQRNLYMKI